MWGTTWSLWTCVEHPNEIHFAGYRLKIVAEIGGAGGFIFKLEKATLGVWSVLAEKTSVTMKKGYRFGIAVQSGVVSAWRKIESGAWEEIFNVSDSSYTEGYVGFDVIAQDGIAINFEAGHGEESGTPSVENPGTQHTRLNKEVSLQIKAVNATHYAATGLPTGLSINSSTGLITGTAEAIESPLVKVVVENEAAETASATFEWVVFKGGTNLVSMIVG